MLLKGNWRGDTDGQAGGRPGKNGWLSWCYFISGKSEQDDWQGARDSEWAELASVDWCEYIFKRTNVYANRHDEPCLLVTTNIQLQSITWPFAKLRPLTLTGKSERSICLLCPTVRQLHGCAPVKHMQSFQIFIIFRLDLWILSSSWLNTESGALSKVMLVIWQGLKEIYILYPSKIKRWKV